VNTLDGLRPLRYLLALMAQRVDKIPAGPASFSG
jgi:hypothetical protein